MMHDDGVNGDSGPVGLALLFAQKTAGGGHDLDEAALKPYFQLDRMIERGL